MRKLWLRKGGARFSLAGSDLLWLIRLTKEVLAQLMALEHRFRACTDNALGSGGLKNFLYLKQWFLFFTALAYCELNHFGEFSCRVYRKRE